MPHVWRARRARYGELVQWDTSEHDWLEGRGEKLYLIAMIDDATSELTAGFAPLTLCLSSAVHPISAGS